MTKRNFIEFLKEFRKDFEEKKPEWENRTLGDFFEAMEAYTEDVQGYYDNMKLDVNADVATWENFKTILQGASVYE